MEPTELKTITEICIEVDNANELADLRPINKYVWQNGRRYSLIHLRFMGDHIDAAIERIALRDAAEFRANFGWLLDS